MKQIWKTMGTAALAGTMLLGSSVVASAEEIHPAGYHVYDVQEDEVTDTWYGTAKGTYLRSGISKLKEYDTGYALCSGHTLAHTNSDRVYVRVYLDQSANGTSGWGNVNYWTAITNEDTLASVSSGAYKVDRDQYYSVQGAHSVTEGGFTESTNTCTNALLFD